MHAALSVGKVLALTGPLCVQHAKLQTRGCLGTRTLAYLQLASVLRPPLPMSLLPVKWLGLW